MLEELADELAYLSEAMKKIQVRFRQVDAAMKALELLAEESDEPLIEPPPMPLDEERGFTDKVREILKANSLKRLTALEIRDVLVKGDPKSDPKIVLIHAHNTLKRLHKQDEVEETQVADGRSAYQWKGTTQNGLLELLRKGSAMVAEGSSVIPGIRPGTNVAPRKTMRQRIAESGSGPEKN
jgi:hypothetical protein